jgi:hypothetical protein
MSTKPQPSRGREQRRRAVAQRVRELGPPTLPEWPADRPRPDFASEAEEVAFLRSYSFANYWSAARALRIEPGASALIAAGEVGAFAHLHIVNLGAFAPRVRCWVRFLRKDGTPVHEAEMPARWSSAPEPFTICLVPAAGGASMIASQVFDPGKVADGYVADFAAREQHSAAVAVKLADGTCWGWPPDSYEHAGRHPRWPLPPEPLVVQARVLINGRDHRAEFTLDASVPPKDFRVLARQAKQSASTGAPEDDEVSRFGEGVVRLKVLEGGAGASGSLP